MSDNTISNASESEAAGVPARLHKFIEAAAALAAEGVKVTYAAVFERAGGKGSMTDVAQAIKHWRSQQAEAARPAVVRHDLPESETQAVLALMGQLWAKAETEAQAVLERERQALEAVRAEVEDEKAQALAAADASLKERDAATQRAEDLDVQLGELREQFQQATSSLEAARTEKDSLHQLLAEEKAERDTLSQALGTANGRAEELGRLLDAAKQGLREAQEARGALERKVTVLETEKAGLETRRREAVEAREEQVRRVDAVAAELAAERAARAAADGKAAAAVAKSEGHAKLVAALEAHIAELTKSADDAVKRAAAAEARVAVQTKTADS